tara:strand:+ start:2967 stop:3611 length:645 start_codon:yes stop_codon:yes gene_type:complete
MSITKKLRKGGSRRSGVSHQGRVSLSKVPFAEPRLLPDPPSTYREKLTLSRSSRRNRVSDSQPSEVSARTNKEIIWPEDLIHDRSVYRFHRTAIPNAQNMQKGSKIRIVRKRDGTERIHPLTMIVTAERGHFNPSNDGYYYALADPRNNYLLIPVIKHPTKEEYRSYEKKGSRGNDWSDVAGLLAEIFGALAMGKKKTIKKRKKKQKKQKQQKK